MPSAIHMEYHQPLEAHVVSQSLAEIQRKVNAGTRVVRLDYYPRPTELGETKPLLLAADRILTVTDYVP